MSTRIELWSKWIENSLFEDISSTETLDPVPIFDSTEGGFEKSSLFDEFRKDLDDGKYVYMLYFFDKKRNSPDDIRPVYIGESNTIASRLHRHYKKIRNAVNFEDWNDDGAWGSWSKYDHIRALCQINNYPLCVWAVNVETVEVCPYGFETYRQELESKLIGLIHTIPRFDHVLTNREYVPNKTVYNMGKVGPDWVVKDELAYTPKNLRQTPNINLSEKSKTDLWYEWIDAVLLPDIQSNKTADPIPLFETDEQLQVELTQKDILKRNRDIDRRIRREGKKCVSTRRVRDDAPEGLLYIMYQLDCDQDSPESGDIIPRYIGKAEAYGKKNELSDNFVEIAKSREKSRRFARWGDGDAWHIGELSNTVLAGERKKISWANALFKQESRTLKQQTYLWVRAWDPEKYRGPYGFESYLAETEPLLIGLGYSAHPHHLLNNSGSPDDSPVKNRKHYFNAPSLNKVNGQQSDLRDF